MKPSVATADMLSLIRRILFQNSEESVSSSIVSVVMTLAIALPSIIYLLVSYLNLDLWYDEIFSLNFFVFVPIEKIVTEYPVPNNHVFANLLNHFYVHSFGLEDVDLLENPWKIRILFVIYTVITIIYVYLIRKSFFDDLCGKISVLVIVTTLPFLNFTLQVRGYSISMSLISMLIYHSFLYYRRGFWVNGIVVVLSTSLAIYTIPSNFYIISFMPMFFFSLFLIERKSVKKKLDGFIIDRNLIISLLIIFGIILSILFYTPIIDKVLGNDFVKSRGYPNFDTISSLMPQFFARIFSGRWLLVFPSIAGFLFLIVSEKENKFVLRVFILLFALLIFPFL